MRQRARHAARGVVLGQAIRGEDVREALVGRIRIRIVRTLHRVRRRVAQLRRIEIVRLVGLERLVVRGQRSVLEARRNVEPSETVRMHDERRVAGERLVAAFRLAAARSRALTLGEVRNIVAGPLLRLYVPPHQLLALAPRLAVRRRGASVVEDAPVERPRVPPAVAVAPLRLALECPIHLIVLAGEYTGVDPAAARGGAVGLQVGKILDRFPRHPER